jgi:hypothetical protein
MNIMSHFIESFNHIFGNWISSQSYTEIIVGSSNQRSDCILAFIIDFISTNIDMLELDIFK